MGRKSERQTLVTLLQANTTLQEVYDHEVKDFRRVSPVAMVHSDGTSQISRDGFGYAFLISLWWRRSSDGGDTEDAMDDLSDEIYSLLLSQHNLLVDSDFSQLNYPVVDGVMYRREVIRVVVM